jgi:hexosaminidase
MGKRNYANSIFMLPAGVLWASALATLGSSFQPCGIFLKQQKMEFDFMRKIYFLLFLVWCTNIVYAQNNVLNGMPMPAQVKSNNAKCRVVKSFSAAVVGNPGKRVYSATTRTLRRLDERVGLFFKQGNIGNTDTSRHATLLIQVQQPAQLQLYEDESYQLQISDTQIRITAPNDLGALHAMETLLQILSVDAQGYYFPGVMITDTPRFAWRGLLLDVCLHWMPMDVIKRTLDGMAAAKLNVFHFHFSEDQAFRVESKVYPLLTQLGAEGNFFTQDEVKEIIAYASDRGIRVIPEIDVPGHATAMIKAYPALASIPRQYELQRYYGVFDPTLDVTKEYTYQFLDTLFGEMAALFPDAYFHIGGDENTGKDWENSPSILAYMQQHGIANSHDLQTSFNSRLLPILTKYHKKVMGWDEILQPGVPKDIVIQSWRGGDPFYASIKQGYTALLSTGYYIDLIQPTDYHYLVDLAPDSILLSDEERKRILGGEATMWTEHTTAETVDSRIWPRTAAIAERLWSPKEIRDVNDMYRRLDIISLRLEELGSTHLKNKAMLMRRLANGYNTKALEVLVDVIEPLKIYERNEGDTMYNVFSPYTKIADVATPDQKVARTFRNLVDAYLANPQVSGQKEISRYLQMWQQNDAAFMQLVQRSPVLQEAVILSKNLSIIAGYGLQAMQYLNSKAQPTTQWKTAATTALKKASTQGGRCDLQVVTAIEKLVNAVKTR